MEHPEVPDSLKTEQRRVECGLHLWEGPQDPKADFVEREFQTWPTVVQEKHFAEAVLMAVRGVPSVLAAPVPQTQQGDLKGRDYPAVVFLTSDLVDETMGKFAESALALASDRAVVWRFGKTHSLAYHDGLINQAFGATLVGICMELHEFVCTVWDEIQTSPAPLSVVHNRLAPYAPLFSLLCGLLDRHQGKCGCMVIRYLEEAQTTYVGHPVGEITMKALLDRVCEPFFEILEAWVYEGSHIAPWEFPLTRPGGTTSNFMAWELSPSGLPNFLQPCAGQILQCGKLALILREAGREYKPRRVPMRYDADASVHANAISGVFQQANEEVLHLLKVDHQLLSRISFLHHFILCGSGDWVSTFMDHCWNHPSCALDRTVRDARWDELQRAVKNACELTASGRFPSEWLETLRLEPAKKSLIRMVRRMARMQESYTAASSTEDVMRQDMEVIQAIQLTTPLEWPVSLVVHDTALSKYQLLGRLVLRVKGLLYVLHRFRRRKGAKLTGSQARSFRALCALRGAMIHFLSNLETYLLFEVIGPGFVLLKQRLAAAKTVEEIITAHDTFTDECIVSAMATSEGLYKRIEMVFLTIRLFASSLQTMEKSDKHEIEAVKRFHTMYRQRLGELLKEMQASSTGKGETEMRSLRHMLCKLDFNRHYLKEGLYSLS